MKLINIALKIFQYSICSLIVLIIRFLSIIYIIKFDCSYSSRIGHFAGILSLYLSERHIKNLNKKSLFQFFIHEKFISNQHLETLLSRKIFFLSSFFYPILIINKWIPGGTRHLINYKNDYFDRRRVFEHRDINNLNDTTSVPVQFTIEEIQNAQNDCNKIGIYKNDKIIIVNIRDNNYLKILYPDNDWSYKTQNADIKSYKKTIEYLLDKGYKVVRCGLHHQDSINISNKNYIDLFNQGIRTSLIENYLTSICLFQIGSYSGGTIPAHFLFRKPVIYTNYIPLSELHLGSYKIYIILKKIYDKKRKKNITTSEYFDLLNSSFGPTILNTPDDIRYHSNVNFKNLFSKYQKEDFEIIDNTQDEILDAVLELLAQIESSSLYEKNVNLENIRFREIFLKNLKKYPNLKKFYPSTINSKIGQKFLQANENFLN
ncbi:TIGR04372 family glycosyltransferase [Candidatus Pelagibacter ubique]|nr:TIGR04372 family glycosyltransferase [Candidatus Pelagibacter ubique]